MTIQHSIVRAGVDLLVEINSDNTALGIVVEPVFDPEDVHGTQPLYNVNDLISLSECEEHDAIAKMLEQRAPAGAHGDDSEPDESTYQYTDSDATARAWFGERLGDI